MKRIYILFLFIATISSAQSISERNQKIVIPGEEFEANFFYELFFGEHWRDVWTTPIKIDVLNLDDFADGVRPFKCDKSMNTKVLFLKGFDGRIWKFKTFLKDPVEILPQKFQYSVVADIVEDQVSSAHPFASIIAQPMLSSVGLLHAKPSLVVLPDSEKLGEFRKEFAGLAGTIEIAPYDRVDWSFEASLPTMPTCDVFTLMEDNPYEKIDATQYLKARLMDIFLGDWERHMEQWNWVKYEKFYGNSKWFPIPQDKSQAFSRFDGILTSVAASYVPPLVSFDENYPSIENIAWNARFVDRRILPYLTKTEWDSVTTFLIKNLNGNKFNEVKESLPSELHDHFEKELLPILISRKNQFREMSDDYYQYSRNVIDIYGSNNRDYLEIIRKDDETLIKLYEIDGSETKIAKPFFENSFSTDETNEIRIFLLESDDKTIIKGEVEEGIDLRIIGGQGEDQYYDYSIVKGNFLYVLPIEDSETKTFIYDDSTSLIVESPSSVYEDNYRCPNNVYERYASTKKDRGSSLYIQPILNYTSDDGYILALGPEIKKYGFNKNPFSFALNFKIAYTSKANNFSYYFDGKFNQIIKNLDFQLEFLKSELFYDRFFGLGNETYFDPILEENDFYKVEQEVISIKPTFTYSLSDRLNFKFGLSLERIKIDPNSSEILNQFKDKVKGTSDLSLVGTHLKFNYDSRNNVLFTNSGLYLELSHSFYPYVGNFSEYFYDLGLDLRYFINYSKLSSIALKTKGSSVWGDYPFFKSAIIGGQSSLRGFSRERFAGDAAVAFQSEIRQYITQVGFIVPSNVGIFAGYDIGRVFLRDENSQLWHSSYGAGVWGSLINKKFNFSFSIFQSKEETFYYLQTGFHF